jgi:S1-C subfamily serine protease
MAENPFAALSQALTGAVEKAAAYTLSVDARRRIPASGVAFAADLVLTVDHAVEREENIRVGLPDGNALAATLAGRDPGSDLALLRLERAALTPALVSPMGKVGQPALALARPGSSVQAGFGIISAIGGPVRTARGGLLNQYFRLDHVPYPGFSGGPLVDAEGNLLGINTSGLAMNAFLSIPAGLAWEIAGALKDHGRVKRGYLGVRSQPVALPAEATSALHRDQKYGLLLVNVEESSPAGQAGLIVGDILVAIGGQPVNDPDDLMAALSADVAGKVIAVEVIRGGQPLTLTVTVGER